MTKKQWVSENKALVTNLIESFSAGEGTEEGKFGDIELTFRIALREYFGFQAQVITSGEYGIKYIARMQSIVSEWGLDLFPSIKHHFSDIEDILIIHAQRANINLSMLAESIEDHQILFERLNETILKQQASMKLEKIEQSSKKHMNNNLKRESEKIGITEKIAQRNTALVFQSDLFEQASLAIFEGKQQNVPDNILHAHQLDKAKAHGNQNSLEQYIREQLKNISITYQQEDVSLHVIQSLVDYYSQKGEINRSKGGSHHKRHGGSRCFEMHGLMTPKSIQVLQAGFPDLKIVARYKLNIQAMAFAEVKLAKQLKAFSPRRRKGRSDGDEIKQLDDALSLRISSLDRIMNRNEKIDQIDDLLRRKKELLNQSSALDNMLKEYHSSQQKQAIRDWANKSEGKLSSVLDRMWKMLRRDLLDLMDQYPVNTVISELKSYDYIKFVTLLIKLQGDQGYLWGLCSNRPDLEGKSQHIILRYLHYFNQYQFKWLVRQWLGKQVAQAGYIIQQLCPETALEALSHHSEQHQKAYQIAKTFSLDEQSLLAQLHGDCSTVNHQGLLSFVSQFINDINRYTQDEWFVRISNSDVPSYEKGTCYKILLFMIYGDQYEIEYSEYMASIEVKSKKQSLIIQEKNLDPKRSKRALN